MARPKATVATERLCVTIPADEVKAAKRAAATAGVTWADFVRQALLSQSALEADRSAPRSDRSPAPAGNVPMSRLRPPVNPGPIVCKHKWKNMGWGVICETCKVKREVT
jgi:hypothetical protein